MNLTERPTRNVTVLSGYFICECNSGVFFLMKRSISAFSHISLFLFSSITFDAAEKRRSLSTLVQGADKYLRAACARAGKRDILLFQNCSGLSFLEMGGSLRYAFIYKEQYTMYYNHSFNITHKHENVNTVKTTTTKTFAAQSACIHS